MAAIGKIRSWGPVLVTVIGLALFAFIAEEMFRSCEASKNNERQQVGEVLGERINVQDFQNLVDEYQEVIKMTQGRDNLSEEEMNQVKDQVWNTFVSNKIMEDEAEKLGLTVTDEEMQNILREGTNPMLLQTPFVNQQTGRFDATQLQKFLNDYKSNVNPQLTEQYKSIYDYWCFIEKNLRQQTLAQKYQSLLSHCLLSNPVSAKAAFDARQNEMDIMLAALPYSAVKDDEVKFDNADVKNKYNEKKEMFKQTVETRDIKYVDFQVLPSASDREALLKSMQEASQKLQSGAAPAEVVRKAQSQMPYVGLPVTKAALPSDIASRLDSMSVGQTTAPFESSADNTLNVVKFIGQQQLPDSVEFRMIQVGGETTEAAQKRADSIYTALKGGAPFDSIAKKYGQEGTKQWLTSAQYQNNTTVDADTKEYLMALNTMPAGELKNLQFSQGNVILQVTDRRAMVTKYDVAVIKHTIDFSKQTYSDAYNKFSQYVSENKSIEALEKNADKFGFKVSERANVVNSEHYVAGIRATRETMKWIFDAKPGDVSPLYECGSNDHLLVVALNKIHPVGYRALDATDVQDMLKIEVIRDKKFETLKGKLAGVKSIADAQAKGAKVDTVKQITFGAPVFVQSTGTSEPALAGAVAATKAGEFHATPIKGNGGVFVFQVLNSGNNQEKAAFNAKETENQLKSQAMQAASRYMQELYQKADVTDKRYLFF
ncbi:MAG: SurA N-terminal domain-containing protein [Prevotella sp.]|nr:SurA N-terminal domain-containing protein [Prevotella sp.]